MVRDWRPTPAESDAIRRVLWAMPVPDWVSPDDLRQAGLIYLWRRPPRTQDRNYLMTCLRNAMTDELRRQMGRTNTRHEPVDAALPDTADLDTPEALACVRQALRILSGLPPQHRQALDAVLECETHREAAARMGLDPARITQLLSGAATCGPSVRARLAAVL